MSHTIYTRFYCKKHMQIYLFTAVSLIMNTACIFLQMVYIIGNLPFSHIFRVSPPFLSFSYLIFTAFLYIFVQLVYRHLPLKIR